MNAGITGHQQIESSKTEAWVRETLQRLIEDYRVTHGFTCLAAARDALEVPEQGEYVVVSRVVARDAGGAQPGPFALRTGIEPLFLVQPSDSPGGPVVRAFEPGEFYPNFSRIRF